MTTILTDEQVDAVYKEWLHSPGHENEHDLIRRAARAALAAQPVAREWPPKVTEEMHVAAVKALQRASGLDGLPQRMLDAMLAAAPSPEASNPVPMCRKCKGRGYTEDADGWGSRNVLMEACPACSPEASKPVQAEAPKWVALPYATPSALWRAFNAGTQFVLHYHGKAHAVTHMSARENFVYVQPPGMPVKIYPDGRNCESAGDAIWLEQVAAHSPASGVVEREGWKEAAIAWEVCASLHRQWAKGKDALFTTRQTDFVKHAADARAALATQPLEQKPVAYRISDPNEPEIGHWYEDAPNGTPYLTSEPLYLGPQPEQVAQDSARLDWLCQQFVTVRIPMRYGSRECFMGSPDDNDGESVPWDIRSKIDAARASGKKGGA